MRPRQLNLKLEERHPVIIHDNNSESDISEDISQIKPRKTGENASYIDQLDKAILKSLRIEVNLNS